MKLLTEHETLAAHLLAGEDHLRLFEVVNALGKRQVQERKILQIVDNKGLMSNLDGDERQES